MRAFLVFLALFLPAIFVAQAPSQPSPAATAAATQQQALTAALMGRWTGVLEYRDYSEPAGSTKRVQLPTWLTVRPAAEGISLDYVYDDGPNKTVSEHSTLMLDLSTLLYRVMGIGSVKEQYTLAGMETLKDGRGVLILTGSGKDAGKPADIRVTWTIRRNLLSWLEEVRPAGSTGTFAFRHMYTFTRAEAPSPAK